MCVHSQFAIEFILPELLEGFAHFLICLLGKTLVILHN